MYCGAYVLRPPNSRGCAANALPGTLTSLLLWLDIRYQEIVRFLPPFETIAVFGRGHRHSLKKLYQEWGVPPWLRGRVPLLFWADQLIGVPGYYFAPALAAVSRKAEYYNVVWQEQSV